MMNSLSSTSDNLPTIIHVVWEHQDTRFTCSGRIVLEDEQTLFVYVEDEQTVKSIPKNSILERSDQILRQNNPISYSSTIPSAISEKELLAIIRSIDSKSDVKFSDTDDWFNLNDTPDNIPLPLDGYITIKDGELRVVDPSEGGRLPILCPHDELEIRVNGEIIKTPTHVRSSDLVSWSRNPSIKPYELQVSPDQLQLFLKLSPDALKRPRLRDISPRVKLVLLYDLENDGQIWLKDHILQDLLSMGIMAQINEEALDNELFTPSFHYILLAEGTPLTPSKDGYLECIIDGQPEEGLKEVNGRVDYRERLRIPTVNPGDVIAIIHSPINGINGKDLYGKVLQPKPPKQVAFRLGKNVELNTDGRILALKQGRPSITGQIVKTIEVCRSYTVHQNVDIKTGNIYFAGDLLIYGDVCEGMRVEASGNIHIHGNVYSAYVVSAQHVNVSGNVFNSQVAGGQHGLFLSRVYVIFRSLAQEIEGLMKAATHTQRVLRERGTSAPPGHIIALLVESKFKKITENFKQLSEILAEAGRRLPIPIEYTVMQRMLTPFSQHHLILTQSVESLTSILFAINKEIEKLESSIQEESHVTFSSATNSTIQTNGSIIINGLGVMTSNLFAGKNCVFRHPRSVLKGGKVQAGEQIIAQEVGSEFGSTPYLQADKSIQVTKLQMAKIKIQDTALELDSPLHRARFYYDEALNSIVNTTY
ncbi:FapA family protein [Ammoniphilus sp. CFH 90114]|uniref:FapA family protein n=1 Tax=Ammoniphilus sp. CFH 90114 TaxID=2493665 RepID=UPI001010034E|nr:FapA family protein [Ammoniphilus sp. CFH 90114]RXT15460.1 DUF342 domain-containing protein [Ammoniphilus sp. CFH 90114]